MFINIRPIAGAIAILIVYGIPFTILSRILKIERARKIIPSIKIIHRAAWKPSRYEILKTEAIFATHIAKKAFKPMPGAIAKGLLANIANTIVPIPEAIQVARNTAFQRGVPTAQFVRMFGFSAIIYAIVIKVVRPASTSVFTFVPFSLSLNIFFSLLFFIYF